MKREGIVFPSCSYYPLLHNETLYNYNYVLEYYKSRIGAEHVEKLFPLLPDIYMVNPWYLAGGWTGLEGPS
jgi:hypothetical protein